MSVQINIVPKWTEDEQKIPLTKLEITTDLSKAQAMLELYDILVETILTVQSKASSDGKTITTRYPYTELVRQSGIDTLHYEVTVQGIVEEESLYVESKGFFVCREEKA